jgi:hypothetical protein
VQIVEDEDDRLGLRKPFEDLAKGPRDLFRHTVQRTEADRTRNDVGDPLGVRFRSEELHQGGTRLRAERLCDHLPQRPIADSLSVGETAPTDNGRIRCQRIGQFLGQARLADPCRSDHDQQVWAALAHDAREDLAELRELCLTTDKRCLGLVRESRSGQDEVKNSPCGERTARSLPNERLQLHGVADQAPSRFADHDLAWRCRPGQSSGGGDGLAGDGRIRALSAAGNYLSGADRDPRLQFESGRSKLVSQTRDCGAQIESRAHRPERVILVNAGHAEHRHERLADPLIEHATVRGDDGFGRVEIAPEYVAQHLGVELTCKRCRLAEVAEEHSDRLSSFARRLRLPSYSRIRARTRERGFVAKDRSFELTQFRSGLEAELVDQMLACPAVGLEGLCLPAAPVERDHQLALKALPKRVLDGQPLELWDQLRLSSKRKLGLDALLECEQAELFEPSDFRLGKRLVREVGKRRSTPER